MSENDKPMPNAIPVDRANYDGWVIAYVTPPGAAVQVGYLGRLAGEEGNVAKLEEAIEFVTVQTPQRSGGITRTCHGSPIEFLRSSRSVSVAFVVCVPLDGLRGEELNVYRQAEAEVAAARASIQAVKGEPMVQPVGGPGLVGPNGAPLGQ